jgi:hypothetical protein
MLTYYNIVVPLIKALLLINTFNLSFTLLYFIRFFNYYKAISLKYNFIKLLNSFYLYNKVLNVKNNIKIKFINL